MLYVVRQLWLCARLWYLGVRESLQLQRFVVLLALDEENQLWAKTCDCMRLHGCIFLGSLAWWTWAAQPALRWTLRVTLQPVAGAAAAEWALALMGHLFHALWAAPAYAATLLVSATWYNEIVQRAVYVRARHAEAAQLLQQQQQLLSQGGGSRGSQLDANGAAGGLARRGSGSGGGGGLAASGSAAGGAPSSGYENAAQELYRMTLFGVMYLEVWLLGLLPAVGPPLYVLFTCWLYAYYCFDYQWTLRGARLRDRLALFEGCAPFFAGYGLVLTLVTVLLPFYVGAALMSLLFPVFVLVACDSNVPQVILQATRPSQSVGSAKDGASRGAGGGRAQDPGDGRVGWGVPPGSEEELSRCAVGLRLPVFALAAWPTRVLLDAVLFSRGGGGGRAGGGGGGGARAAGRL